MEASFLKCVYTVLIKSAIKSYNLKQDLIPYGRVIMHGCIELKTAQTSTVSRCKNMAPLCCKEEEIVSGKKTRKSVLQAQEICADNSSKQKCNKSLELLCKLKHLAGVVIYELLPFTKIQETMHCAQLLNCRAHMLYECTLKSESTSNN